MLKWCIYSDLKEMITKREMKTTWTLFMVCICYFIFVMPITLVNVVNVQLDEPTLHLALFCIYWLQYSLNFFIYAGRSEQYRKAYSYFIHKVSHLIWYLNLINVWYPPYRCVPVFVVVKRILQQQQHYSTLIEICCQPF